MYLSPFCAGRARCLAAVALVVWAAMWTVAPPAGASTGRPVLGCHACLLIDDHGRVLISRRAATGLPNASTTKMTTALVVIEKARLDEVVTVSTAAAATGGGGLALEAGERHTVRVLLHALLLTSSNDAAVALAEHVAGSEGAFVAEMQLMARRLGARHSGFVTAHGLDAPGHYASASDLARTAAALLEDDFLAEVVATDEIAFVGPDGPLLLENRNPLLEAYPGAVGVKTGYTRAAGNVLVAAAVRSGRRLIAVAMRSTDAAADTRAMLDYGFDRLAQTALIREGERVSELLFLPAGSLEVVAGGTARGIADPERVEVRLVAKKELVPPLVSGDRVGTLLVVDRGEVIARVAARAAGDLSRTDLQLGLPVSVSELLTALLSSAGILLAALGVRP